MAETKPQAAEASEGRGFGGISPNWITAARLPMAPLAVALLVTDTWWGTVAAAVLSVLLEVTDLLDGWMARRFGMVTSFGKLFDPFSDAFSRFTLFLGIYAVGAADLWMIIAIFYRDSSISFIRTVAAVRSVVLAARPSGKIKAIVQGVGTQVVFASLLVGYWQPQPWLAELNWWTMFVVTAVTMWSFVDYVQGSLALLRAGWFEPPGGENS